MDGAVHRAGGPEIMKECREIGACPTGTAVITTAGNLKAKFVIHTVGPIYREGNQNESRLLASAYRSSLELAVEHKLKSVAFPSISTGVYGYPISKAADIALSAVASFLEEYSSIELIRFVLFDDHTFSEYQKATENIGSSM